jgi:hypothetical protein
MPRYVLRASTDFDYFKKTDERGKRGNDSNYKNEPELNFEITADPISDTKIYRRSVAFLAEITRGVLRM